MGIAEQRRLRNAEPIIKEPTNQLPGHDTQIVQDQLSHTETLVFTDQAIPKDGVIRGLTTREGIQHDIAAIVVDYCLENDFVQSFDLNGGKGVDYPGYLQLIEFSKVAQEVNGRLSPKTHRESTQNGMRARENAPKVIKRGVFEDSGRITLHSVSTQVSDIADLSRKDASEFTHWMLSTGRLPYEVLRSPGGRNMKTVRASDLQNVTSFINLWRENSAVGPKPERKSVRKSPVSTRTVQKEDKRVVPKSLVEGLLYEAGPKVRGKQPEIRKTLNGMLSQLTEVQKEQYKKLVSKYAAYHLGRPQIPDGLSQAILAKVTDESLAELEARFGSWPASREISYSDDVDRVTVMALRYAAWKSDNPNGRFLTNPDKYQGFLLASDIKVIRRLMRSSGAPDNEITLSDIYSSL